MNESLWSIVNREAVSISLSNYLTARATLIIPLPSANDSRLAPILL